MAVKEFEVELSFKNCFVLFEICYFWNIPPKSLSFSSTELKHFTEFDAEVCRSLVALYDLDQTGKLEFGEFEKLWADLRMWKVRIFIFFSFFSKLEISHLKMLIPLLLLQAIFQKCDADDSGSFDVFELRHTLSSMGKNLDFSFF